MQDDTTNFNFLEPGWPEFIDNPNAYENTIFILILVSLNSTL